MTELAQRAAAVHPHARPASAAPRRLLALDIVRGYAMLLMLISHSSWWLDDLDYGVAYGWDNMIVPTLVFPQSAMGFVLQLATPAFFLLSGFSVALFAAARRRRGWSEWRISRFFVIRGLLLIALDVTVVNLRLSPPHFGQHLSVLTGVGVCLLLMAWLRRLDWRALAAALAVVLMGTQLYYHSLAAAGDWPRDESLLRAVLLAPSVEDITWKTQFPAPGWLPIVLLGFIMGARTATGGAPLGRMALRVGLGCLALFALTMAAGDVGSLYPANPLVFSKHPPDLAYITLYTGLTCLLIALHSRPDAPNTAAPFRAVAVLGQTALFFYLVHIRLIELVSPLIARLPLEPLERSLLIVAATLPALLFLCAAYRFYKREHPDSILQYL